MSTSRTLAGTLPTILFFAVGAFWAGVVLTGGGFLLLWGSLTGFLSGIVLVVASTSWVARPLAGASSLFGLAPAVYQLYVASTLFGTRLSSVGSYSVAAFAVITVVYLYLLLTSVRRGEES